MRRAGHVARMVKIGVNFNREACRWGPQVWVGEWRILKEWVLGVWTQLYYLRRAFINTVMNLRVL
jgi:hypothetical protein